MDLFELGGAIVMVPGRIVFLWQAGYPTEIRLAKMIATFRAAGSEVAILCRRTDEVVADEIREGVRIVRVGFRTASSNHGLTARLTRHASLPVWLNPLWASALRKLLLDFRPDTLIVRDIPLALLASRTRRASRPAIILDMAEHYPEAMRSWRKYTSGWLRARLVNSRLPDWIERKAVEQVDGVVVVCEEQKERLQRTFSIPGHQVAVVLNTPDLSNLDAVKNGVVNDPPCVFGYHGILCNDRNLRVVLEGFTIAARKNARIRLLICGDGESADELRSLWRTSDARDRIDFTGRYALSELPALYARVDFGIVSLLKNEFTQNTLANKFFDYAATGKPFIYTRLRPLENVMKHMQCGEPFESGDPQSVADAMLRLLDRDYTTLARNGKKSVQSEFNWNRDGDRLLDFVCRVSDSGRHARRSARRKLDASSWTFIAGA